MHRLRAGNMESTLHLVLRLCGGEWDLGPNGGPTRVEMEMVWFVAKICLGFIKGAWFLILFYLIWLFVTYYLEQHERSDED